jgi:hypothetical protein
MSKDKGSAGRIPIGAFLPAHLRGDFNAGHIGGGKMLRWTLPY